MKSQSDPGGGMFGSHDHDDKQDDNPSVTSPTNDDNVTDVTDSGSDSKPAFDTSNISLPGQAGSLEGPDAGDSAYGSGTPAGAPVPDDDKDADKDLTAPSPSADSDSGSTLSDSADSDDILKSDDTSDLVRLKQDALHELSPLVGHLEQTPEEKFRTTMMMIQAADDQSLLQTAYDAAKAISDDKVRAQALLDVINEINYFTQQSKN